MENDQITNATSLDPVGNASNETFGSLDTVGEAVVFALPLGLFVWSFNKSISYFRDNSTKDAELEDLYDSELYSEAIIPLYKNLNTHLATTLETEEELTFEQYEEQKHSMLEEYDYSQISGVVGFADSIEKILQTQAGRKQVKKIRKRNRGLLIAVSILSGLSLISALVYYLAPQPYASWALYFDIASFVVALFCAGAFYMYSLKLDSIQNEKR